MSESSQIIPMQTAEGAYLVSTGLGDLYARHVFNSVTLTSESIFSVLDPSLPAIGILGSHGVAVKSKQGSAPCHFSY